MNAFSTILGAAIALLLLANVGSVFWQMLCDRPFRVIYLPISARAEAILRLLGIGITAMLLFDRLVTQYIKPDLAALVLLLGFALINALSVYYRWRWPLRTQAVRR